MTEQYPDGTPDHFDAFSPPPEPLDRTMVFAPVPDADPPQPAAAPGFKRRIAALGRTKLAVAGVVAAAVLGGGAWAAASMGSSPAANGQPVAGGGATSGAPAPGIAGAPKKAQGKKDAKPVKVAITQVGTNTFSGTDAKGEVITVTYGDDTKFGTKAAPLSADKLTVGTTVSVLGERSGDSVAATSIAEPKMTGR